MPRRDRWAWSVSIRVQTDEDSSAMPQILKTLDEIARDKQRDVLCVRFFDPRRLIPKPLTAARRKLKSELIQFLDDHSISWSECFDPATEHLMIYPYSDSIYLDVPYDLADPGYRLVADYLETPGGEPKYEDMHFCVRTLVAAIKTADDRLDAEDC
jgi:hypothetical protein